MNKGASVSLFVLLTFQWYHTSLFLSEYLHEFACSWKQASCLSVEKCDCYLLTKKVWLLPADWRALIPALPRGLSCSCLDVSTQQLAAGRWLADIWHALAKSGFWSYRSVVCLLQEWGQQETMSTAVESNTPTNAVVHRCSGARGWFQLVSLRYWSCPQDSHSSMYEIVVWHLLVASPVTASVSLLRRPLDSDGRKTIWTPVALQDRGSLLGPSSLSFSLPPSSFSFSQSPPLFLTCPSFK